MTTAPADLGFDPDALRDKYRRERDKRLRADGNDQYLEVADEFAHFVDDPYVTPGFTRAMTLSQCARRKNVCCRLFGFHPQGCHRSICSVGNAKPAGIIPTICTGLPSS